MKRVSSTITLTIASGAALSDLFEFTGAAGAVVDIPSAWTTADLAFYHCATRGGTYQPLYDDGGTLIEIDMPADPTDQSFVFPAGVFPARFLKLWSELAGSGENQGAARSLIVSLKT